MRAAVPAVLVPGRHPEPRRAGDARARSTRAASSATRSRTPTAPPSTTRTWWCCAWSATARPRPARWPRAGTRTSSSTRAATAPCCRSCTSTATRSPTRRCSRGSPTRSCDALMEGYGHRPIFVEGSEPAAMHRRMAEALDEALDEIAEIQRRAREEGRLERPRWPMIVLRSPKGWTGPGSTATTRACLAPGPAGAAAREPRPPRAAGGVAALLPPGGAVRRARGAARRRARPGARGRAADERQPARQRRPAAPGPAAARLPRVRRRRPRAGRSQQRGHARARRLPARRHAPPTPSDFRIFGPDETASNRLAAVLEVTGRTWLAEILPTDDQLARDGRVMEVLSEHLCQGWLEGYLLTGRHGLFNCYEAFIHIVDSMFNQHAKWLKVTREHPVAAADRVAQLPAHLARLAPGPQRLLAPGPRLHRPRREQEGGDRARLPAAGRQLPAVGRRPLPAQPRLRERDRGRQAARARLPRHGRRDRALHARHRHLGLGASDAGERARRGHGVRGRRADARDAVAAAALLRRAPAGAARCGSSTSST